MFFKTVLKNVFWGGPLTKMAPESVKNAIFCEKWLPLLYITSPVCVVFLSFGKNKSYCLSLDVPLSKNVYGWFLIHFWDFTRIPISYPTPSFCTHNAMYPGLIWVNFHNDNYYIKNSMVRNVRKIIVFAIFDLHFGILKFGNICFLNVHISKKKFQLKWQVLIDFFSDRFWVTNVTQLIMGRIMHISNKCVKGR